MRWITDRLAVGHSGDLRDEDRLIREEIGAAVSVAKDLDVPEYQYIKGVKAGLIAGPGCTGHMLNEAVKTVENLLKVHHKVIVCGHAMKHRVPIVVASYLAKSMRMDWDKAFKLTLNKIPEADPHPFLIDLARRWFNMVVKAWSKLVSVCIPVYDRLDLLKRCVKSIRERTEYEYYELIILDDGSPNPDVYEYIRRVADVALRHEKNEGIAKSRNDLIEAARGEYICFVDSDAVVFPGWLTGLVETLAVHPKIGIVSALPSSFMNLYVNLGLDEDGLISVETIFTTCALYRRKMFEIYGGFDEDLWNMQSDLDFGLRVNAAGEWRMVVNPRVVIYHPRYDEDGHPRSLPELRDERKLFKSLKILKERWGIEHERYKELAAKFGAETEGEEADQEVLGTEVETGSSSETRPSSGSEETETEG